MDVAIKATSSGVSVTRARYLRTPVDRALWERTTPLGRDVVPEV